MYKFTDNAMESGVAICDTDITNDNLMNLKYSDKSDFIVEAPHGILSNSGNVLNIAQGIKVAIANGIEEDKTYSSILYSLPNNKSQTVTDAYDGAGVFIDTTGAISIKYREETNDASVVTSSGSDYYLYNTKNNYYYDSIGDVVNVGLLGWLNSTSSTITNVKSKEVFRPAEYREFKEAEAVIKNELAEAAANIQVIYNITDRNYPGVNLAVKFASEIANYANVWAWIKARITAGNYNGIHVGDYIPVQMRAGTVAGDSISAQTFNMQIAGIDTYTNCTDQEVGHHIDFISKEVIDKTVMWNPTANNNGTSVHNEPWLASKAYAWLNGVNNYTTSAYQSQAHGVNASSGGILQLLPGELTNLIVTKRMILDTRYSSSGLLTYSTNWGWQDMGKLWLPNETEVYGTQFKSNVGSAAGHWNPEAGMGVAYPIYLASGKNRIKRNSSNGRCGWWLSSAVSCVSSGVCGVNDGGFANGYSATNTSVCCPVCFRIA